MPVAGIDEADVGAWPFSVGLPVRFAHFWRSLHWPQDVGDLGVGGVSYFEFLILYDRWAGERLVLEKAMPLGGRAGRPIAPVGFRGVYSGFWPGCLEVWVASCLAVLVLITVGFGVQAERSVGTVSLLVPGRRQTLSSWILFWGFWATLLGLVGPFMLVNDPCGIARASLPCVSLAGVCRSLVASRVFSHAGE